MTTATQPVYSWKTKKTEKGYVWSVYTIEYQKPNEIVKSGISATRATAAKNGKVWTMYLKRISANLSK